MKKIMILDTTSAQFESLNFKKIFCTESDGKVLLIDGSIRDYADLFLTCSSISITKLDNKEILIQKSQIFFNNKEDIFCIFKF